MLNEKAINTIRFKLNEWIKRYKAKPIDYKSKAEIYKSKLEKH